MSRIRYLLLSTIAAALLLAPAAIAKTHVAVGIGDQSPAMFSQKNFKSLHIKKVRYVIRWDAYKTNYAVGQANRYVSAARKAHVRVLMHITTNDYRHKKAKLPSVRTYKKYVGKIVRHFRARGVKEWGVWNEANHISEPTWKNPKRAAQYFHVMRSLCKHCTIVALDVLDDSKVGRYISRFYRGLSRRDRSAAKLIGIHNYEDTNRHRTSGTRRVISAGRAQNRHVKFWFTETGGIVRLGRSFKCSTNRAARSISFMFSLAKRYRHDVTRLYAYNWFGTKPNCGPFDAGLVNYRGKARKGYKVFKSKARSYTR